MSTQTAKRGIASGHLKGKRTIPERMERVQAEMHSLPPVPTGPQPTPASDACETLVQNCKALHAAYEPIMRVGLRYMGVQRG